MVLNILITLFVFFGLLIAEPVHAKIRFETSDFNPGMMKIKEDDYLGKTAPDIRVTDESGATRTLSSFSGKPLILLLIYYDCPNTCPLLGEGLSDGLGNVKDLTLGRDYHVLVLSFNKDDTPAMATGFRRKLESRLKGQDISGWVFATASQEGIDALTMSVGYRYFYSAEDRMFVHPNVFVFLSPERMITRYLFGVKPDPFNIRMAVLESSRGLVGKVPISSIFTLACYKYDIETRGYVINLPILFASVGAVMALMTGILSYVVYRKKRSLNITYEGGSK
jgi:protein SCO1/2